MRILHTGDIHLGDLNGPTRDGTNLRRLDTIFCMRAIVERAKIVKPHVSIIAGDLFNRSRVWADTALEDVNDAYSEFIVPLCAYSEHVVLLFGTENHDNPLAFETLRQCADGIKNFHIYTQPTVESLYTEEGYIQIMAVPGYDKGRLRTFCPGVDKETENRNATALINDVCLGLSTQLDRDIPSVMVAHYTVAGSEADNGSTFLAGQDVVITPDTIFQTGVDLACFGHIHRPQQLNCQVPAFYCGSINQLTFNDEGTEHGFWIHQIGPDRNWQTHNFYRTPERMHFTFRMDQSDTEHFIQTGEIFAPYEIMDAIVRVRYEAASAEQDKALNRAELQKAILNHGAFWVSEILAEDVGELDAREEMTEQDSPTEALRRWLELNNVDVDKRRRLMELAEPIIKKADDGRDSNRHSGIFLPLMIDVKNYRSYTEAQFDFREVRMAMVNGQNGVGKSSLFMDAIADCLFEQTRSEDIGGWVRDGTKSGSIAFVFSMGEQQYQVVRTRTKSGRGTLSLQRRNIDTGAWEDESDTTMRLTQEKIERLIGMDCNTFCSIALIRQDAYGIFLEASSDRRMEVLSDLLSLDIYTSMETIANENVRVQKRELAAAKDKVDILKEQTAEKERLSMESLANDREAKDCETLLEALEGRLAEAERAEALSREVLKQFQSAKDQGEKYRDMIAEKRRQVAELQKALIANEGAASLKKDAEEARKKVDDAKESCLKIEAEIKAASDIEARYRKARKDQAFWETSVNIAEGKIAQAQKILNQKEEITAATVLICDARSKLTGMASDIQKKAEMEKRYFELSTEQRIKEHQADTALDGIQAKIDTARKQEAQLAESGCPVPDRASCKFMADAVAAKNEIPKLEADLEILRDKYSEEIQATREAAEELRTEIDSLPDYDRKKKELEEIIQDNQQKADMQKDIAVAESTVRDQTARLAELKESLKDTEERILQLEPQLKNTVELDGERTSLYEIIGRYGPAAALLPDALSAEKLIPVMKKQIEDAKAELQKLEADGERIAQTINELAKKYRNMTSPKELEPLRQNRDGVKQRLNACIRQRGEYQAKLDRIAEIEDQIEETRLLLAPLAEKLNDYQTLSQAFGLDGIQYMIIRNVVPEIMHQSNEILSSMTGGKMAVDIHTEKELKSSKKVVNSLEVWVTDINGNHRPYLSHSGGEKVRIALAVTLGLADVKARHAGVQLGMLHIDEPPFLDGEGTDAYADALLRMATRNPNMRILAISHDPAMKARFSQNIMVTAGENGSTVTME